MAYLNEKKNTKMNTKTHARGSPWGHLVVWPLGDRCHPQPKATNQSYLDSAIATVVEKWSSTIEHSFPVLQTPQSHIELQTQANKSMDHQL